MPRSSGVYSLPGGSLATDGQTATASTHNTPLQDLETDMNTARPVVAGGTGATTAAAARVNLGVRTIKAIDTAGSSNAYTITTGDSLTPADGDVIVAIANHTNTGAATLNADATSAVAVKKMITGTATALAAGDLVAAHHYFLTYDAGEAAWLVHNPSNVYGDDGVFVDDVSSTTVTIGTNLVHAGDADTYIGFSTDTQSFLTGGSNRVSINNSGVQLGATGARVTTIIDDDTMATASATTLATSESIVAYVGGKSSLAFISSQDASASATLDFTGFASGSYDAYLFVIANLVPATDDVELWVRLSNDAGSTYEAGATYYGYAGVGVESGIGTINNNNASDAMIDISRGSGAGNAVGSAVGEDGYSGTVMIAGPHLAKKTQLKYDGGYISADGTLTSINGVGIVNTAEANDAARFMFSTGNIESGTITMYGLRNA